jgi:RpiB/LacA/LacB family sugar-phosphate isomerase
MSNKKYNLVIPIAGKGSRFLKEEYVLPKPLILVDDKSIIEWTMKCIDFSECNVIFIVRKEHVVDYNIDGYLRTKFGKDITIVETDKITDGALCSVLLAEEYINNDTPLILHCSDIYFEPQFKPSESLHDGLVLTFKSNSTNYSYVETYKGNGDIVKKTAEKQVISPNAAVGIYCYKSGKEFVQLAKEMIKRNVRVNNEFYICPLYNLYVEYNKSIKAQPVEKMYVFGTPEELKFFVNNSLRTFPKKRKIVALCSDHSGFEAKELLKTIIDTQSDILGYIDFGVYDQNFDRDYYEYVNAAANAVLTRSCDFGIGFCRSGQGINISANKIKGIRSAWVIDSYLAEYAVRHGCCNFFAISSKYSSKESLSDILTAILNNTFDGGRHQIRISKLE